MGKKVRTTITIDEELLDEVTKLSEDEERSVSQQIVYFVKIGLEDHKKKGEHRED